MTTRQHATADALTASADQDVVDCHAIADRRPRTAGRRDDDVFLDGPVVALYAVASIAVMWSVVHDPAASPRRVVWVLFAPPSAAVAAVALGLFVLAGHRACSLFRRAVRRT